jgi:sugar phosphate permease
MAVGLGLRKNLTMVRHQRFFYGWVIVGIAVLSMTLVYGIRHSFSIFFASILDEFGWSRGSTALMFSLNVLIYGLLAPLIGGLSDRWKPRRVIPLGICILGLGTACCAFAHKLWHFYLLFGIAVPMGMASTGWPVLAPALSNWFVKRRGLTLGVGQMGAGFSFAYGMFAEFTISQVGWRNAYFVLAGMLVAFLLPAYVFFFYYRPEDKGLRPYGAAEKSEDEEVKAVANASESFTVRDWTLGQAMRTCQLWLLVLSLFFYWGIGTYLVLAHQVKFVVDVGYSSMFAASVFALYGIIMLPGQLSSCVSDWVGREITVVLASLLNIVALIALVSVRDTSQSWLLYVYAITFGFGAGLYSPTIFAGAADIFHGRHFGSISGLLLTGMGIGGCIGPWLGGYIYDVSGSYRSAFVLCMVCFALSCITFVVAAPRKAARIPVRA